MMYITNTVPLPITPLRLVPIQCYRQFTGKLSWHNGLDLRAKNEPAYAMMDGFVEKVGYDNRSGNYVTLRHGNFYISYCHLSSIIVRKVKENVCFHVHCWYYRKYGA